MEKYYWSLDISTTNIGSALWDSNGNLIELKHLELKTDKNVSVENRDIYKAEIFMKYVLDYKDRVINELNGEISNIIVEEPLGGSNNRNTVSLLFGFNGMCRLILRQVFKTFPVKISVHESRKLFCDELVKKTKRKGEWVDTLSFPVEYKNRKKEYIWEKVCKLEPNIEWVYKKNGKLKDMCFDMSDSYAVGFAYLKKIGIL